MTVFRLEDLKTEALHAVIRTTQMFSDLVEAMALTLKELVSLPEVLRECYGCFKPQSGYGVATAAT
jgi:hypothetical protein